MYKVVTSPKGKRYLKDGRFIKFADVPDNILSQLRDHSTAEEEPEVHVKKCIFCGAFGRYTRFVNLQTIELCEEHYYSESVGKIVHKLKETQNG